MLSFSCYHSVLQVAHRLVHHRRVRFEEDFDQFQMERGYCVIGGPAQYSPQFVRDTVLNKPNAWRSVTGRAVEITARLGGFLTALSVDKLLGRNNQPDTVRKRASQLRCELTVQACLSGLFRCSGLRS